MTQNTKQFKIKFATLSARAVFVCRNLLLFAPKTIFLDKNLYFFFNSA
jgi:hypothetical protein